MPSNIYNNSMLQLADVIIDTFGSSSSYEVPVEMESYDDVTSIMPMISINEDTVDNEDVVYVNEDLDPIPIGTSKIDNEHMTLISLMFLADPCSSTTRPHKLLGNHSNTNHYGHSMVDTSKRSGSTRTTRNNNTTKRQFSKIQKNDNGISGALECRDMDVLFGRGGHACSHPGNLELLRAVKMNRGKYRSLSKTLIGSKEKRVIVQGIVSEMLSKGSRFLYREKKGENKWREASSAAVYEKVSHMLRDKGSKFGEKGY